MRTRLDALVVVACFLAGCGGLNPSPARQAVCPQGSYATQNADARFRSSLEVVQGRRGPEVQGYIYNNSNFIAAVDRLLLGIERLSPSGEATGCSMVWVVGVVPPRERAYFSASVPDANAKYRVRILSFSGAGSGAP